MLEAVQYVGILIACLAGSWFGSFCLVYTKQKGKNLADIEDAPTITRIKKAVKDEFAKANAVAAHERSEILEKLKAREGLRQLAGERRLAALQEAYALWRHLSIASNDNPAPYKNACRWWQENSLYLDPIAREAFASAVNAWMAKRLYAKMEESNISSAETITVGRKEAAQRLHDAGNAIVEAAGIPPLAGGEIPQTIKTDGFVWQTPWGVELIVDEVD
ncbi:MAG: hypothetical protein ACREPQ_18320 [Rhodanobacter sp.]